MYRDWWRIDDQVQTPHQVNVTSSSLLTGSKLQTTAMFRMINASIALRFRDSFEWSAPAYFNPLWPMPIHCVKCPTGYDSSQFVIMLFVNVLSVYQNVMVICHFPVITMSKYCADCQFVVRVCQYHALCQYVLLSWSNRYVIVSLNYVFCHLVMNYVIEVCNNVSTVMWKGVQY